ncbi:uncharacterized protein VICG_00830 [Vittaforma corneae ATCC 50505]|uniref:Uncharacterized protein n=1 Tax=Vittaforma corneae (strain ATCC 50505) TaxID=993615 RepID=L2GPF8_VITCO|nr:uncharacterized protein VICG_00830 [Vittaforma corneae ATCC 50505]ELA42187.1 hypothetical protein VICG_00830 [Vittaforma corneae ATCC 50505]
MSVKYKIASSSTEEGEVHENTFPYTKSYLQYCYYPLTTQFIGKNTLPNIMNYKSEGICQKLKKEIKADYPYISFTLLDNSKPFFDNRFTFICDLTARDISEDSSKTNSKSSTFRLVSLKPDYKEIKNLGRSPSNESRYDRFFQKFFFMKEDIQSFVFKDCLRIFALEDRVFENLDNKNAFMFFRVCDQDCIVGEDQTSNRIERKIRKYAFEDVFYSSAQFYEYLNIYSEALVRSHCSEEIKTYNTDDSAFIIYSSTSFKEDGQLRRMHSSFDSKKNVRVIFNKDGPVFSSIQGKECDNIKYLVGLDLPEGDYVVNDKKVYKIGTDGIHFEYKGLLYEDFTKSIWDY